MKGRETIMKNKIALAVTLGALITLPACGPIDWIKSKLGMNKNEMASVGTGDDAMAAEGEILVSMDGKAIISTKSLERDFEQLLEENPQLKSVLAMMPDAKYNFLQGMVSQAVVDKYVQDSKIDQKAEYQADLNRMMRSVRRMLNTKYFGMEHAVEVTDAEIEKFYAENKDTMPDLMISRGGVKASGISFAKEDAARAFAAKAKGNDFARVAKESGLAGKISDFKMVNGQSLGMDTAVKNRIISMKKFPAVELVKGEDKAYWVVHATEAQEAKYRPLEQVKAGLKQFIEKEKRMAMFDKEITKLKETYKVSINENPFKAPATQVADQTELDLPAQTAQAVEAASAKAA